jgi:D-xylose transport system permease protein
MALAMAEIWVLLLGEIDLSAGFVAGVGGVVAAELMKPGTDWPFWAAVLVALGVCALIGAVQGSIIARLGLPSFIVTLAGLLAWQGAMLYILGTGEGLVPVTNNLYVDVANGFLSPVGGWVAGAVIVAVLGTALWRNDARRRAASLPSATIAHSAGKVAALVGATAVGVIVSNIDRGSSLAVLRGVPWVALIVIAVASAWTSVVERTTFGRYLRAIGGNAEAARRTGVDIARIKTQAFVMSSVTAGVAGIIYASRLRSVSSNLDGGGIVLYSVAAAVIGGTSLFGGRGRMRDGVLGGIVIAAIDNGMSLQGYGTAARLVVTAIVLVLAVTLDALARRHDPTALQN